MDKKLSKRIKERNKKNDKREKKINEFVEFLFNESLDFKTISIIVTSTKRWRKSKKGVDSKGMMFKRVEFPNLKKKPINNDTTKQKPTTRGKG